MAARCEGMDARSFFPPERDTKEEEDRWYEGPECALVLRICGACDSRVACFKYALEDPSSIENGVYGGTTPKDRARYLEALSLR